MENNSQNLDLDELKKELNKLKTENEKLKNRFGLVWKDVPEKFIKYVSDEEILYGESLYKLILDDVKANGKTLKVEINGDSHNLNRQSDSYLFKSKETDEVFLLHSNKLYQFEEEIYEQYVPILEDKGGDFFIGDNDKNVLIEGDNYFALQMLQYTHRGKVDVVYIDPPYNTGKKDFVYNDAFVKLEDGDRHSSWLSFMRKRLVLARTLLCDSGVVFISIDSNEYHRLKLLADDVFGEENYTGSAIWKKSSGKNDSNFMATVTEFIISYRMSEKRESFNYKISNTSFKLSDERGGFNIEKLDRGGLEYRKNNDFVIEAPDGSEVYPHNDKDSYKKRKSDGALPRDWQWRYSKERFYKELNDGNIHFSKNKDGNWSVYSKKYELSYSPYSNLFDFVTNSQGNKELDALFDVRPFSFPKPLDLIKHVLKIASNKSSIVLDFFSGSGTTGHAVWDLNKEDGGNRKFILVTNNENNICEDVTFERLKRANSEEHGGYNESLKYLKIRHVNELELHKIKPKDQYELLKEIINLKNDASFKVIESSNDWYVTDGIAVLLNNKKINEFFLKFANQKRYALVSNLKRHFFEFTKNAEKFTTKDNIIHMSKDYLDNIKKELEKEDGNEKSI